MYNNCYDISKGLSPVNKEDLAADELAKKIGGIARVKFNSDADGREFDAVSDEYIAQAKPALKSINKDFREQAKETFEAAKQTGRKVYYEFADTPSEVVIKKLREYENRYGVPLIIKLKSES